MNNTQLEIIANKVRQDIIVGTFNAKSGHPGGSLSATECMVLLYNEIMNIDPADPDNPDRDRFVLSKGHAAPGLILCWRKEGSSLSRKSRTFVISERCFRDIRISIYPA